MNAIILAGGKGARLQPWHAPKTLLPINGVTILERLLQHLLCHPEAVVDRAIVCTGYRAADITASVEAHGWMEDQVAFSDAGEAAPMGERLLLARKRIDGGRVVVCYGDELADVDMAALLGSHVEGKATVTVVAAISKTLGGTIENEHSAFGIRIVDDKAHLLNIGYAVIEPEGWEHMKPEDGLSDFINRVADSARLEPEGPTGRLSSRRVRIFYHQGKRATVNSLADLACAEEMWR